VVLAAGLSVIVTDGIIAGVSLPAIIAALLLTAGRLGDRIGRRRLFIAGVLVFIGGSLLAVMTEEAAPFIAARVVQGIGGHRSCPQSAQLGCNFLVDGGPQPRNSPCRDQARLPRNASRHLAAYSIGITAGGWVYHTLAPVACPTRVPAGFTAQSAAPAPIPSREILS
jgi:MFS family permease